MIWGCAFGWQRHSQVRQNSRAESRRCRRSFTKAAWRPGSSSSQAVS
jgi:hypothetical protein